MVLSHINGAVRYQRIKVTDAERTEIAKKCLSGDGSRLSGSEDRRGSRKERICTEQVTDKKTVSKRTCNRCIMDNFKKRIKRWLNDHRMNMRHSSRKLLLVRQLTVHNLGRTDINVYTQDAYRMPNA